MLARLLRNLLSFIFTVSCLFSLAHQAHAQSKCQTLFKPVFSIGTLKPTFKHNKTYSSEVSEKSAVKNQCQLGTCHLHAWASTAEKAHLKRTGESIQISMPYLTAVHWLQRTVTTATDKNPTEVKVKLGATWVDSRNVIRQFGIVPEGVWTPKIQFEKDPVASRLEEFIVNRIAKAKWEIEREISETKKNKIRERAEVDLNAMFDEMVGERPESFFYQGRAYTPVEFAKEKFPELFEPRVNVLVNEGRKEPTFNRKKGDDILIDTNLNEAERMAREAIDAGESVYLTYEHNSNFVDKATGVMSIRAFKLPKNSGPMSRAQRKYFETKNGGHAVQLIGYDADPATGKIIKWKIQNSWGEKSGDKGIYHMYSDYFRTFLKGFSFSVQAGVALPVSEVKTEEQYLLPLRSN